MTAEVQQIRQPEFERLLYTKKDASKVLSISVRKIDYLIADKRIRFTKNGKKVLFHIDELRRIAKQAVL